MNEASLWLITYYLQASITNIILFTVYTYNGHTSCSYILADYLLFDYISLSLCEHVAAYFLLNL